MFDTITHTALAIHYVTDTLVFWIVTAVILVTLLIHRMWYESAAYALSLILTTGTVQVLKTTFAIPRSADALVSLQSYAFPSAHAAASMFLAVSTTWLLVRNPSLAPRRTFVIVSLFSIAAVIGVSRILIGVHTPFEVLGGYMVGCMIPIFTFTLFRMYIR